jgi:hypothetical protein
MKTKIKGTLDEAREFILSGNRPAFVVSSNTKTGITILDNVPQITCAGGCPIASKCYDVHLLKIRPSVMKNRAQKHYYMQYDAVGYSRQVIKEIVRSDRRSVRLYGGGDFAPHHFPIITRILRRLPSVKFYMISKTIRSHPNLAKGLLSFPNFHLNMSEAEGFLFTGTVWDRISRMKNVSRVYTLMPGENPNNAAGFDIVFNVSKAKDSIAQYKKANLALCPCDAKDIEREGACSECKLCSVKGGVRGEVKGRITIKENFSLTKTSMKLLPMVR